MKLKFKNDIVVKVVREDHYEYLVETPRMDRIRIPKDWVDVVEEPIEPWTKVYAWNSNVGGKVMGWYIGIDRNGNHEVALSTCSMFPRLFEFVEAME